MARCVQIRDYFSVEPQAIFLDFTIYLLNWKSSNLKIWRLSKYAITSFKQLNDNEICTLLGAVIFPFLFFEQISLCNSQTYLLGHLVLH